MGHMGFLRSLSRKTHPAMNTVRCSVCNSELKHIDQGGSAYASILDMEQWLGNVCIACRRVYCSNCMNVRGPTPCPRCGTPTKPAQRMFLREIGTM